MGKQKKVLNRKADGLVIVDGDGRAVVMSEADRLAFTLPSIKEAAAAPWQCGDAIPLAVARGPLQRFQPTELVPDGQGGHKVHPTGYRCRDGARVGDVFDRMVNQALRSHAARVKAYDLETTRMRRAGKNTKKRKPPAFEPPFTWGQVQAARDYAALVERCNASGVKCSSLESLSQSSGAGGDREAAIFADFARLRLLHRRIGTGLAKRARRHRPSESSAGHVPRSAVTVRSLVDRVCLGGMTISEILKADGWALNAKIISDLRLELCMALDRMQGYEPSRPQNVG